MSPISVHLDTSPLPHSLDSESHALSSVTLPQSTPPRSRRYNSCYPSLRQCGGTCLPLPTTAEQAPGCWQADHCRCHIEMSGGNS